MSENAKPKSKAPTIVPRARDLIAGAVVLLVLGGVLMSRGGRPHPTLADAPRSAAKRNADSRHGTESPPANSVSTRELLESSDEAGDDESADEQPQPQQP